MKATLINIYETDYSNMSLLCLSAHKPTILMLGSN